MNWVSVDDRLPLEISEHEIYKTVAVLVTDGNIVQVCEFATGSVGELWREWNQYNTDFCTKGITHWMVLPEPPQ
jgi:hypothetical protein